MNEKQINPKLKSQFSENICPADETVSSIENTLNSNPEEKQADGPEFLKLKAEFLFLVKKYLCYRSDGNMGKIFEFLNKLDVTSFNKILNYFEEQRDKAKIFQVKQDLAILYAEILEKRNTSIIESREKLYAKNAEITDGKINLTNENNRKQNQYLLKSNSVEILSNGYGVSLDYGDGGQYYFRVDTSNDSFAVMDELDNPLKCNVEKSMDISKENIGLGQIRIINIKKYRIQIGNQYFVLKFND